MLAEDEMPRSNTASFTTNWSKDLPDDSFLNEVVNRWRAQTFNPDSAAYTVEAAPAVQVTVPAHPSIRRDASQPQRPGIQPAPQGFGQHAPAPQLRRSSDHAQGAPTPIPVAGQQASLANLIKQFRT